MRKLWVLLALAVLTVVASCGSPEKQNLDGTPQTSPKSTETAIGEPSQSGDFTVTVNSVDTGDSGTTEESYTVTVNVTVANDTNKEASISLACFQLLDDKLGNATQNLEGSIPSPPVPIDPNKPLTSDIEYTVPAGVEVAQVRFQPCVDGNRGNEVVVNLTGEAAEASASKGDAVNTPGVSSALVRLAERIDCGPVALGSGGPPGVTEWGVCSTAGGSTEMYLVDDLDTFLDDMEQYGLSEDLMAIEDGVVLLPDDTRQLVTLREALS